MSAKEGMKIKQILTSFSDCDRRQIYTDGLELTQDQDSPSSHETCLPSLHIAGKRCAIYFIFNFRQVPLHTCSKPVSCIGILRDCHQ